MDETISTQLLARVPVGPQIGPAAVNGTLRPSSTAQNRFLNNNTSSSWEVWPKPPSDPAERSIYEFLVASTSEEQGISSTDLAGGALSVLGKLTDGKEELDIIGPLSKLHAERVAGKISLNSYQQQQQVILNSYFKKVGWLGRSVHGGDKAFKSLYHHKVGVGANSSMLLKTHAERLARLSKYSKTGGILLTGVGVANACLEIAKKQNVMEKNEVLFAEATGILTGAAGGALAGAAVGAIIVSGPIGWAVAFVVTSAAGYFSQQIGKQSGKVLYDKYGGKVDYLNRIGIDKICK